MSLRPARPAPFLVGAAAAILLAACESGFNPMEGNEKAEDERAKLSYYTDAAKTYFEGGKYESAARMWEKVLAVTPDDQWARFGYAKSLQMQGKVPTLRKAEAILLELEKLDWSHPQFGDVKYRIQTALAATYSDLADFYDRDARALEARLQQELGPDVAVTLREQKQQQLATRNDLLLRSVPRFEAVLQRSREDPYALAGLAKANLLLGNDIAGIDYASRYVALARRSREGHRRELRAWEKTAGRDVTAEQRAFFAEQIQGTKEKEKGVLLLLGSVRMRREEFVEAVEAYDAVLDLDPAMAAAFVERAQAYAALGQHARAIADLEEYLKVTDPVKHRKPRLKAADLLDRYRRIEEGGGVPAPAEVPAAPPPSPEGGVPSGR
jgi:tetratricopeptide (TPR) repeat protein